MKKILLIFFAFGAIIACSFDMSRFDHEKHGNYKYRISEDGEIFFEDVSWSLDTGVYHIIQERTCENEEAVFTKIIKIAKDARPFEAYRILPDGKTEIETIYDHSQKKVRMRKLDGKRYRSRELTFEDGCALDGFSMLFTVSGMGFTSDHEVTIYSNEMQRSAGMNIRKKGEFEIEVPAGTFNCFKFEQSARGLLSAVVPRMQYYIDKETRLLVKFILRDTVFELDETQ